MWIPVIGSRACGLSVVISCERNPTRPAADANGRPQQRSEQKASSENKPRNSVISRLDETARLTIWRNGLHSGVAMFGSISLRAAFTAGKRASAVISSFEAHMQSVVEVHRQLISHRGRRDSRQRLDALEHFFVKHGFPVLRRESAIGSNVPGSSPFRAEAGIDLE